MTVSATSSRGLDVAGGPGSGNSILYLTGTFSSAGIEGLEALTPMAGLGPEADAGAASRGAGAALAGDADPLTVGRRTVAAPGLAPIRVAFPGSSAGRNFNDDDLDDASSSPAAIRPRLRLHPPGISSPTTGLSPHPSALCVLALAPAAADATTASLDSAVTKATAESAPADAAGLCVPAAASGGMALDCAVDGSASSGAP